MPGYSPTYQPLRLTPQEQYALYQAQMQSREPVQKSPVDALKKLDSLSDLYGKLSSGGSEATAVGSAANGGTMMSDGSIVGGSNGTFSLGNVAGAVAAAKGTYDAINGLQHGGEGLRSGLTTAGAGIGQLIGGPLGAGAGAVLGNVAGYGLQGNGWKNKLALTAVLPPLGVAKMLGFNPIHKTTRQRAQEHTKDLLGKNKDDSKYQAYTRGMREQYNSAPPDPSKPFAGKYATWDEYKKAGLEAKDLTGVYGNIKTFGKDWSNIDQGQREKITQGLIDAGLYKSKKGEVEITDADKAKQIYAEVAKLFSSKK